MAFWTLVHDTIGLHVYDVLLIVIAAAIIITAVVQKINSNKRLKKFKEELEGSSKNEPSPAEEPAKEEAEK